MKNFPTILMVVAAALIDRRGRVLLQQRPPGKQHEGLWEFPGGKVEPRETLEDSLVREIREELGLELLRESLLPLTFATLPGDAPVILLYTCRSWRGEVQCLDGQQADWFDADGMARLAMPPLDVPLARVLADHLLSAK